MSNHQSSIIAAGKGRGDSVSRPASSSGLAYAFLLCLLSFLRPRAHRNSPARYHRFSVHETFVTFPRPLSYTRINHEAAFLSSFSLDSCSRGLVLVLTIFHSIEILSFLLRTCPCILYFYWTPSLCCSQPGHGHLCSCDQQWIWRISTSKMSRKSLGF